MEKKLRLAFLDGIERIYFIRFYQDFDKLNYFVNALKDDEVALINVIACSVSRIKISSNFREKNQKNLYEYYLQITNHKKDLAIFFHSYYACPLVVAEEYFDIIKQRVYTNKGMHIFDLDKALYSKIKQNNIKLRDRVCFLGNICEEEDPNCYDKIFKILDENNDYIKFALIGITGSVLAPSHFYGIYINTNMKHIFIYNSVPKNFESIKQVLIKYFPFYTIITNNFQNQFNNDLCGFFASYFLNKIAYSEDPIELFEKEFNQNQNLDSLIFKEQNEYVDPVKDKIHPIDLFFKCLG